MQFLKKSTRESSYRSDHSMITLELNFTNFEHGKSYWKHNKSLLSDIEYLKQINVKITEVKRQYAVPIYNLDNIDNIPIDKLQLTITEQLFLDVLLMEIQGKAISYASYQKKEKDVREKYLSKTIKNLENIISEDKFEQIEILKTKLINIG